MQQAQALTASTQLHAAVGQLQLQQVGTGQLPDAAAGGCLDARLSLVSELPWLLAQLRKASGAAGL